MPDRCDVKGLPFGVCYGNSANAPFTEKKQLYLWEDAGIDVLLIVNTAVCCWLAQVKKNKNPSGCWCFVKFCYALMTRVVKSYCTQHRMLAATNQWEELKGQSQVDSESKNKQTKTLFCGCWPKLSTYRHPGDLKSCWSFIRDIQRQMNVFVGNLWSCQSGVCKCAGSALLSLGTMAALRGWLLNYWLD